MVKAWINTSHSDLTVSHQREEISFLLEGLCVMARTEDDDDDDVCE